MEECIRGKKFLNITLKEMNKPASHIAKIIRKWKIPGIVLLTGSMGVGKTTLTRLTLECLGVRENVNSPTFSIMNEYIGETPNQRYFHFDFYRIHSIEELEELGFQEIWGIAGHSFIEWSEKFPIDYPYPRLHVKWLPSSSPESRSFLICEYEKKK